MDCEQWEYFVPLRVTEVLNRNGELEQWPVAAESTICLEVPTSAEGRHSNHQSNHYQAQQTHWRTSRHYSETLLSTMAEHPRMHCRTTFQVEF